MTGWRGFGSQFQTCPGTLFKSPQPLILSTAAVGGLCEEWGAWNALAESGRAAESHVVPWVLAEPSGGTTGARRQRLL